MEFYFPRMVHIFFCKLFFIVNLKIIFIYIFLFHEFSGCTQSIESFLNRTSPHRLLHSSESENIKKINFSKIPVDLMGAKDNFQEEEIKMNEECVEAKRKNVENDGKNKVKILNLFA